MRSTSLAAALLVVLALVACGGSSSGGDVACGPGTALQGGVCVPSHTCGAGTVDVNGTCLPQAMGGAAGATATGTGGGGAGTAGSAIGGSGASSGASVGGQAGAGAAGGAGVGGAGVGGAAGGGQGGASTSVPCPPKIDLNCDPACGTITDTAVCAGSKELVVDKLSQFPFIVRTPPMPGFTPVAMADCGTKKMTAAVLKVGIVGWPMAQMRHYRIRSEVGSWVVGVNTANCILTAFGVLKATCDTVAQTFGANTFIGTSDPNAMPDNITIDTSDGNTELPCP